MRSSPKPAFDLHYVIMWCSKYRRPVLVGDIATRCSALIRAKAAEHGWDLTDLEVLPDRVRLTIGASPGNSPSYVANQLKATTSGFLRSEFPGLRSKLPTLWSRSFFVTSIGAAPGDDAIDRYLDSQYERSGRGKADSEAGLSGA